MSFKADSRVRNFFGTSTHDAMFELENISKDISYIVLGKDVSGKSKVKVSEKKRRKKEREQETTGAAATDGHVKRPKLEMVKTLQKVYINKKKK